MSIPFHLYPALAAPLLGMRGWGVLAMEGGWVWTVVVVVVLG